MAASAHCSLVRRPAQLFNHESPHLRKATARQARMNTNHKSICLRLGSDRHGDLATAASRRALYSLSRCDELSREQYLETGLREMLIDGQRICYSFVLHYDE